MLLLALALFILFLPIFSDAEGIQWQSYKDEMQRGRSCLWEKRLSASE